MKDFKKISKAGSLSIPVKLRREYGINGGDAVSIQPLKNGGFIVKPYTHRCSFCDATENIKYINGKGICSSCGERVTELFKEVDENE